MRTFTTEELFKIIPLDEDLRDRLLKEFATYPAEKKLDIQKIAWDAFHEMFKKLSEAKYEMLLLEVEKGQRKLTNNLMKEAKRLVWQGFEDILSGKKQEIEQLEQLRARLKAMMSLPTSPKSKIQPARLD